MTEIKSIAALVSCENLKIYQQWKYRILLAVTAIIIIASASVSMIPGNILSFTMANYPYTILSLLNYIIAPLAVFMLASDLLSGEMAGSEIRVLLTRPVSRFNVLLSKVLAIAGYAGLMLAGGFLLSGILSSIFTGFSPPNIFTALTAYAVGFLPLLTLITMSVMIASTMKSATSSFGACLITYLGFVVIGVIFSGLSPALFTSYLNIGSMVIGSVIPLSSLLAGIAILTGYSLAFLSVSGLKFAYMEF